jgi:hypothetical protein
MWLRHSSTEGVGVGYEAGEAAWVGGSVRVIPLGNWSGRPYCLRTIGKIPHNLEIVNNNNVLLIAAWDINGWLLTGHDAHIRIGCQ